MFKFSARSLKNMEGVDPRLIEVAEAALRVSPVDFGVPSSGGLRTAEQQRVLFERGASRFDGTRKKSKHQSGLALDVYAWQDGHANWGTYPLTQIATAMLQCASLRGYPLVWGGLWKNFRDMAHFELVE